MAFFGKKDGGGGVVEAGRFRSFGIFMAVIVVLVGGMSYLYYRKATAGVVAGASVSGAGGVTQPATDQTASPEYVKLVREQNIEQAKIAEKSGGSAIATAVRPSYFDTGELQGGVKKGCSVEELKRARESGVSAFELHCRGCSAAALKAAGYTAGELAAAGFSATELKAAGFTAKELKEAGFTAEQLKKAGFDVSDLAAAGFTPSELAQAGFTADQLRFAGFSDADLAAAGIGAGTPANMPKDCNLDSLTKARASGITAAQLKKMGCGAAALRAAGFTAAELKAAGFTAAQLKAAGFTAAELKAAGFSAGELIKAGFSPKELKAAGFTAKELREAGLSPEELMAAGFTPDELRQAGFSDGELYRAGVIQKTDLASAGKKECNVDSLRTLRAQGVTVSALTAIGCKDEQLKAAGFTDAEIAAGKNAVITAADLTPEQLAAAAKMGMTPEQYAAYLTAQKNNQGLTAEQLAAAAKMGMTPAQYAAYLAAQKSKLTPEQLAAAAKMGMTPEQYAAYLAVQKSKLTPEQLAAAAKLGMTPEQYVAYLDAQKNNLGLTPTQLADAAALGMTPEQYAAYLAKTGGAAAGATEEETFLQQQQARQQAKLNATQRQDEIDKHAQAMRANAGALFSKWAPPPTQQFEMAAVEKEDQQKEKAAATPAAPVAPGQPEPIVGGSFTVKAGTVVYGVFNTGVNSDEDSPVLASVVSGKFRGSKLVGKFKLLDQRLLIEFDKISVPWYPKSVPLKVVAVDPETSRTAIAHNVDNHYLVRYGGLFASSFLSGLATALTSSGSTTSATTAGVVTTMPVLSTSEKFFVALGQVGTQYAAVLGNTFNQKPTVTVEAGLGVGFLFLEDAQIPMPNPSLLSNGTYTLGSI